LHPHIQSGEFQGSCQKCNLKWKEFLPKVDIIIMNRGHHATEKEGQTLEKFTSDNQAALDYILNYKRTSQRRLDMYYMTTSPGHAYCNKYSQPELTRIENEDDYEKLVEKYQSRLPEGLLQNGFAWEGYHMHDKLTQKMLGEMKELNATVFDIGPMSYLRPDGHRFEEFGAYEKWLRRFSDISHVGDCLHYFLPSVVDAWVNMFYNVFQ
jgi:hypothetical protein